MYQLATSPVEKSPIGSYNRVSRVRVSMVIYTVRIRCRTSVRFKVKVRFELVLFFRLDIASLHYMCMFVSSSVEIFRVA